jgi:pimeloyl-ACP methyl ester carboxylesterase
MRVELEDCTLHVEEHGAGDPPLLLIAGIPAVASDWRSLAERLATPTPRAGSPATPSASSTASGSRAPTCSACPWAA